MAVHPEQAETSGNELFVHDSTGLVGCVLRMGGAYCAFDRYGVSRGMFGDVTSASKAL
jgi:hypothetical protein